MVLKKAIVGCLTLTLLSPTPAWAELKHASEGTTLFVYPSNHGFLHQTGYHVPSGWSAMYRIHAPGYFIEGQSSGGEALPPGTYRYTFPFSLLPGQLGGLLRNADDVVRIEAWDATAHECLVSRTFQVSDFLPVSRRYTVKNVTFSTQGRTGHRFEPRVYWPGLSGVFLRKIVLERLQETDAARLQRKADLFETMMDGLYLDRGFVICRRLNGTPEDVADAAIWTGLYAASQAWRYQATHARPAVERMQDALRALHQLRVHAPQPGTLVRYIYADGRVHPQAASKDTYTGFFFAVANCLPLIKDKALKKDLLEDVDALAGHFLDHDLAFVPLHGDPVELRPSFSSAQFALGIDSLKDDAGERNRLINVLKAVNFYFLIHGQRPWPELPRMIRHLKRGNYAAVHREAIPFLNGALRALRQLQRNVHGSAIVWRWQDAPYQKLDHLLLRMLNQLAVPSDQGVQRVDDLRFLSSQSVHALHFLKIAGQVLPRPNRYAAYYQENLWQNKALLKTAVEWNNLDEQLVAAITGDTQAAALRTSSAHLSFLALFDLATQEKDPALRRTYQALFQDQYRLLQADYNAMLHVMQPILESGPEQTGVAFWSLMLYPEERQGKGEAYWQEHRDALAARYGGMVSGKARDPLPVNERQRDPFIWQRSARSLRGDDAAQLYPPLDYLFPYWLARAHRQIN